jgi:hypothetical protein
MCIKLVTIIDLYHDARSEKYKKNYSQCDICLQEMRQSLMYLLLLHAVCSTKAARILGIFPTPSFSHQLPFQAIMKALASRGHHITVISPNPLKVFCLLKYFHAGSDKVTLP